MKGELLLLKFLDEYLYQAVIRQKVRNKINEEELSSVELLNVVKKEYFLGADKFINELGLNKEVENICLP